MLQIGCKRQQGQYGHFALGGKQPHLDVVVPSLEVTHKKDNMGNFVKDGVHSWQMDVLAQSTRNVKIIQKQR